jgi:hypothetical protein
MVTCLCLAGTAVAQGQVYAGAGQAFESSGGLVGGFDVLFLRAYGGGYDQWMHAAVSGSSMTPSNDFEISPRVWLGYVGESGFGVRSRWFQYQHELKAGTGVFEDWPGQGQQSEGRNFLDVYAVDIDFMQQIELGCWDVNAGAGIRAGGVKRNTTLQFGSAAPSTITSRFEGVGPTIFAELKRPIIGTGLSLVANARGSVLFGDGAFDHPGLPFGPDAGKVDSVVAVGEIQLGAEYARQLGYGTTGFVQCLWEGQIWSNASHYLEYTNELERADLGLMGIAFNFGIAR